MKYKTAAAFRHALEERLRQQSLSGGAPLARLRKMVAFYKIRSSVELANLANRNGENNDCTTDRLMDIQLCLCDHKMSASDPAE